MQAFSAIPNHAKEEEAIEEITTKISNTSIKVAHSDAKLVEPPKNEEPKEAEIMQVDDEVKIETVNVNITPVQTSVKSKYTQFKIVFYLHFHY